MWDVLRLLGRCDNCYQGIRGVKVTLGSVRVVREMWDRQESEK